MGLTLVHFGLHGWRSRRVEAQSVTPRVPGRSTTPVRQAVRFYVNPAIARNSYPVGEELLVGVSPFPGLRALEKNNMPWHMDCSTKATGKAKQRLNRFAGGILVGRTTEIGDS